MSTRSGDLLLKVIISLLLTIFLPLPLLCLTQILFEGLGVLVLLLFAGLALFPSLRSLVVVLRS